MVATHAVRSFPIVACVATALAIVATGCQPEFEDRASAVLSVRVLGVRSDPAEAPPGTTIQYEALVGDPSGTKHDVPIQWAYCTLPKPVSETNDINVQCLGQGPFILPFAKTGESVSSDIPLSPDDACNQFGPDLPNIPGQPPGRPADPDSTGGYYQPIRLAVNRVDHYDFTVAETRISCNLPGATSDVLIDYAQRYRANQNPILDSVVATTNADATEIDLKTEDQGDSGLVVSPGAVVHFTASWPACPTEPACGNGFCEAGETLKTCPDDCTMPVGCPGAEPYVSFDLASRGLTDRHEAIRVSWYATAGAFTDDRTGQPEEAFASTTTEDTWTAPSSSQTVTIWVVIRDSRGGTSWKAYRVTVQ